MSFSKRIKELRLKNNLTQEQLADEIYVSRQTISKWESGSVLPDLDNLSLLACFFDVSIDYLVNGVIDKTNKDEGSKTSFLKDVLVLIIGFILLVIYILLLIFKTDDVTTPTSMIEINIHSIFLVFAIIFFLFGLIMTYKNKKK